TTLFRSYTNAQGIVPNNKLSRNNVNLRVSSDLTDAFTLDAKLNYIRSDIDNKLNTGENIENPLRHIYRLPRNIRTSDDEKFEYTTADGQNRQHFWNCVSNGVAMPYWTKNRNLQDIFNERVLYQAALIYDIIDNIELMVISDLDRPNGKDEQRIYNDTYIND